ncbi:MAG TPA: hypothetical protein VNQ90_13700 [Chthoniobacteraceae bacterium]|nr:hypothetical protein [Chthoniobacteraceae bacterium]
MSTVAADTGLRETALRLVQQAGGYWETRDRKAYRDASGRGTVPLSARFLADLALGYLAWGTMGENRGALERLPPLVESILARQDVSGAFRWNLPDPGATHPGGVRDQVDLAMVLDTFGLLREHGILSPALAQRAEKAGLRAAAWLESVRLPGRPDIIHKRVYEASPPPPVFDVLNGDALAARAFARAAALPGGERYAALALPFLEHLAERFGRHQPGWWPYAETVETGAACPPDRPVPTVFFQSMMILHLRGLEAVCPPLASVLDAAAEAVAGAVDERGVIDERRESRHECRGKPNVLVADALRRRHPARALARLRRVADRHLAADGGVCDEAGEPLEDKWRIWLFSDLARLLLRE